MNGAAPRGGGVARRVVRVVLAAVLALVALGGPAAAQVDVEAVDRQVSAAGAVLWDPLDERVLWGRDATQPRRMASTTKIMTTWLAIAAGAYDDTVTVSATAAAADERPGAATMGLEPGERIAMRHLLVALMLRSGNDAAVAVAEHVAGSEAAFVEEMNATARDLGLRDTNFINASGLTNAAEHHASPRDMALLASVAMADERFAEIVGTVRADIPGHGTMETRNLLLERYDGATGVKTGYMASAGLCLVASASRDGRDLYAVVLDSDDSFADTAALLDLGYDGFAVVTTADAVPAVYRTAAGVVELEADAPPARTVAIDEEVRIRTSLAAQPPPETAAGTVLGEAELVVDGQVRARSALRATGPLPTPTPTTPATRAGSALEDAIRGFVRATPQRRPVPVGVDRIVRATARS